MDVRDGDSEDIGQGTLECRGCGERFEIENGLPNLIYPRDLDESALSAQAFYDERPKYDYRPTAFRLGIWSITFGGKQARRMWAERLDVREGARVLEVAVGNGGNLPYFAEAVGKTGRLDGLDISSNNLLMARERARAGRIRAELVHGNASYLPYGADQFDAVISVGGFNDFGDKKRALEEMRRVARPGGKVVLMDEGLSPDREKTLLGRYILMCMKVFSNKPPVGFLPEAIDDLKVDWVYQGTFWVIEFRKKVPCPVGLAHSDLATTMGHVPAKELAELLGKVYFFRGLSADELERVRRVSREACFQTGEVIFREGSEADRFYIVLSGSVEVWKQKDLLAVHTAVGGHRVFRLPAKVEVVYDLYVGAEAAR